MPRIQQQTVVDPDRLGVHERAALVGELFAVHQQVFAGATRDGFARHVLGAEGDHNRILKLQGPAGAVVGFMALHIHHTQVDGRPLAVFRAAAGLQRQYRGGASTLGFAILEFLRFKLRHPLRRACYFGALIHPSSHGLFDRWYGDRMWPNASRPTPPATLALLTGLGDHFGMRRVDNTRPLVRDMVWRTRDTEVEDQYWRTCDKPSVRFFLEQNPGYGRGEGLLVLLPLRVDWIVGIALRLLARSLGSRLQTVADRLRARLPAWRPAWTDQARQALAASPLARGLNPQDWARLEAALTPERHAAGAVIVRQGEPGDAMYVIVSGSVYVCLDGRAGEDERLLDSLGPGAVFGEMALVTGAARSTTIRAARAVTLLRLSRAVFEDGLARHEGWQAGIDELVLRRAFRSHLCAQPRFSGLALRDRESLVSALQPVPAAVLHDPLQPHQGALFLAAGSLALVQGAQRVRLQAPAWHEPVGAWFMADAVGAVAGVLPAASAAH